MSKTFATMPTYDAHKNWKSFPLCAVTSPKFIKNYQNLELLSVYLNLGVIRFSEVNEKRTNATSEDLSNYQEVAVGDFVLNNQQAWRGSVGVSKYNGIISPAYLVLSLSPLIDVGFANYYFRDGVMVSQYLICSRGVGTIQRNLYWQQLKRSVVTIPPLPEQTAIADFLDKKTSLIDEAVSVKEQQITLLKERKQILIQNAVTQGLNPNAPMRDSGVEWIGKIPKHWEVKPGFTLFSENKRTNKGMVEERVLSLSYGKIIIKPKAKLVGLVPESFETYQIVEKGDIIIRCMDLQNDKTSLRTGLAKDKGIITSAYLNLKIADNQSSQYLHYYLHTIDTTKVIYKYGTGLRQNLSFIDFKRMPMLIIPLEEQTAIVTHIEKESAKIDQAIALNQQQIEKLKEYKATLINSAVTGKIKVI